MKRPTFSIRSGKNPNADGFDFDVIVGWFEELYRELKEEGYFDEYLGWSCLDMGDVDGKIRSPTRDIMLKTRKEGL